MNSKKISKEISNLVPNSKKASMLEEKLKPFEDDIVSAKKRGVASIRIYEVLVANGVEIKRPSFYAYLERKMKEKVKENKSSPRAEFKAKTHRLAVDENLF